MNVSYKRDMTHNYMVPETAESVSEDDYRVHMLMENHIQGLLPCCVRRVNCQSRFFYDITSRQSMEHVYGGSRMRAEDVRQLLRGLYRALREIKKYLLDVDQLVLESEMIYMDIETREPLFCYLPGYRKDIMQSFRELAAYLLERLDDSDPQAVLLGYEIYRRAREENYSLEKILQEAGAPEEIRELGSRQNISAGQSAGTVQGGFAGRNAGAGLGGFAGRNADIGLGGFAGRNADTGQGGFAGRNMNAVQTDFPGEDLEPGESYGYPDEKGKKTHGKKKTSRKKKQGQQAQKSSGNRKPDSGDRKEETWAGRLFLVSCFCVAVVLLAAAAWFWKLTATQTGGVALVLVGILIYGCTMDGKKKKDEERRKDLQMQRVLDDFEEEEIQPINSDDEYADYQKSGRTLEYPQEKQARRSFWQRRQTAHTGEYTQSGGRMKSEAPQYGTQIPFSGVREAQRPYGQNGYTGAQYGAQIPFSGVREAQRPYGQNGYTGAQYGAQIPFGGVREAQRPYGQDSYVGAQYGAQGTYGGGNPSEKRRLGDTGVLVEGADNESHLILVSTNPQKRDSIVLEKDSYVVGKLPAEADLVLEHPSVSRVHAKLDRLGNDYYLCDLNSTNGTFVNGRRLMVNESVKLNPSDEIAFARVRFQVVRY